VAIALGAAPANLLRARQGPEGDGHRVRTDSVDAPAKKRRALELLAEQRLARTGVVSLQVMQEYFVAATRKLASRRTLAAGKPGTSGVP